MIAIDKPRFLCRQETILSVDDNPMNQAVLAAILSGDSFALLKASDGVEAVEMARATAPDLILMDVMMPRMDGFEAAKLIRRIPGLEDVPILFMSALSDSDSKIKAFNLGAVDYITKPFHSPELLARVNTHLRLRRSYRALVEENLNQTRFLQEAQQVYLPKPEEIPEANFAVVFHPLSAVGGDFFDVFRLDDTTTDYVVADVSGHDIGAFLPLAGLKSLLRQNAALGYRPAENLKLTNRHFKQLLKDGQHATVVYLRIHRQTGKCVIANAGHVPLFLQRSDGQFEVFASSGEPLGCFDNFECCAEQTKLQTGDRLFLFSDGLVEQYRGLPVQRTEGLNRLMQALRELHTEPLQAAVDGAMHAMHPDTADAMDDLLLLGVAF